MKLWLCIFSILFFQNSLQAIETSDYVDQSQHTAFHVFSNSYSSLISQCNIDWPEDGGQCHWDFKDQDNRSSMVRTSYTDLEEIHDDLLRSLKDLQAQWIADHPVNLINQYIFLFRQNDLNDLSSLIEMLEEETLSFRVLMKKEHRYSVQFFSQELSDKVMDLYLEAVQPYDTRFQ